ncbi:MAG: transposase [Clostridia bacterium]|nr:transposase [Clostridia bacterium]
MLRGINQQQIFIEDEDYKDILEAIKESKESTDVKIYAYCLMGNHLHLLIKESETGISQFIKKVGTKYVYWYNLKYRRTGHLFQDRFKSEAVENEKYFKTVIRYIHQNPLKAGLVKHISDYPYSSYKEYLNVINGQKPKIVDSGFVFEVIPKESFSELNERYANDNCLDIETAIKERLTDQQAVNIIEKTTNCKSAAEFQKSDPIKQQKYIKELHLKGISVRQLSRLCGISKGIVEKCIKT